MRISNSPILLSLTATCCCLLWSMNATAAPQIDNRHNIKVGGGPAQSGISVLVREGFVIDHYDYYKVPAWVAVCWDRDDYENLIQGSYGRDIAPDSELPAYAQAGTSFGYSSSHMERGHMARHEDNEAWARDSSDYGCLMSQIVPQHKDINGEAWNDLVELYQGIVVDRNHNIETVWVISGPTYADASGAKAPRGYVGNRIAIPHSTYKAIGWFDRNQQFHARSYVVGLDDRVRHNPALYLRSIDEIEAATWLDFFPELAAARQHAIESPQHGNLWGGQLTATDTGAALTTGRLSIVALLPNPSGIESQTESATLRNTGTHDVVLEDWLLRDAHGHWRLSGTLEAGDEVTVLRSGQNISLNNLGDHIQLIDPTGTIVESVSYSRAGTDEVISGSALVR